MGETGKAKIKSMCSDQGHHGASACGGCGKTLCEDEIDAMLCGGCGAELEWGEAEPYPFGGGDY